jgi:cobalt/nickel transport system permease protein
MEDKTLLHALDPRVKIIVLFLFAWGIALASGFREVLLFMPFVGIIGVAAGREVLKAMKSLFAANTFLFFVVISMVLTYESPHMIQVGFINLSVEGLRHGLLLFLKSSEILSLTAFLLATSSVFSIFHALHHLKLPSKLCQVLFFSFRYLHTVKAEYETMMKAAKCRGFRPASSVEAYRTFAHILASLLIRSYKRADRVYKAMLCRGFRGTFPVYNHFSLSAKDIIFASLSFIYFAVVVLWKF